MKLSRCQTPSRLPFSLLSIVISLPKLPFPLGSLAKILIAPKVLVVRKGECSGWLAAGVAKDTLYSGDFARKPVYLGRKIVPGKHSLLHRSMGPGSARRERIQRKPCLRVGKGGGWVLCCLKGDKTFLEWGRGFHSVGSTSSCPSSIAVAACSGTGELEKGSHRGQGGCSGLWADVENDPAWRDFFPLPRSSVPGKMVGRIVAASNICCSALGRCQPTSHLWQLEVSWWPTAQRLSQGLDVFLEKQTVPS